MRWAISATRMMTPEAIEQTLSVQNHNAQASVRFRNLGIVLFTGAYAYSFPGKRPGFTSCIIW